jgi:hypothetical protein
MIDNIAESTTIALIQLWNSFLFFMPRFIGALIIFFVGVIIAAGIAELIERIIDAIKIDRVLEKIGFKNFTDKAGIKLDAGFFVAQLSKWLIILVFLSATLDYLSLSSFAQYLNKVVTYIPSAIVAVLILLVTALVADFVGKLIRASAKGTGMRLYQTSSSFAKWAIYIVGFLTAIEKLGVPTMYLATIFTGLIVMLAIAGGIAFGLGGKEFAKDILDNVKDGMKE